MALKKQFVISIPYMHPICPMSLSHARIFLVADTIARYKEAEGFEVYLPLGIHYSGKEVIEIFNNLHSFIKNPSNKIEKYSVPWLFLTYYGVDINTLKKFKTPLDILKFFSIQQIANLKELKTKFFFEKAYNTKTREYEAFVRKIFKIYKKKNLIVTCSGGRAINFDKSGWKEKGLITLSRTKVIGEGGKELLKNSLIKLDGAWNFERTQEAIGVKIDGKIINPMFDSQLYTKYESKRFGFKLPIDLFIAETHLPAWIASKILIESLMLDESEITRAYFLLGIALTEKRQKMSSSRGTSVLLKDLLEEWGPEVSRLAIIIAGNPEKDFVWSKNTLLYSKQIIAEFKEFRKEVENTFQEREKIEITDFVKDKKKMLKDNLEKGKLHLAALLGLVKFREEIKKMQINGGKLEILDFLNYVQNLFLP